MKTLKTWLVCGSALTACVATGPVMAQAQSASTAGTGSARAPVELGELVVTASKRAERVLDVPGAITAFSGVTLLNSGTNSIRDFAGLTPGLSFNNSLGTGAPVIRGLSEGLDTSPTVATVVNGAPIGSSSNGNTGAQETLDLDPIDIERVEVLKGPQGTLYGANTLGGLISYTLREPSLTRAETIARGEVDATEHGDPSYSIRAAAGGPVIKDQLGLRLSGYYQDNGGFIDNTALGLKNQNKSDSWGGHVSLLYQPTDKLKASVDAFYQKFDQTAEDVVLYNLATRQPLNGELQYDQYVRPRTQKNTTAVIGNISYDAGFANLTSVTSYQYIHAFDVQNATYSAAVPLLADVLPLFGGPVWPTPPNAQETRDSYVEKVTQEIRLTSPDNRRFTWMAGGYYTHESIRYDASVLGQSTSGALIPTLAPALSFYIPSTFEEISGFANATYKILPTLDLSGGVRVGHITDTSNQAFSGSDSVAFNTLLGFSGAPLIPYQSPDSSSSNTFETYLATLRFHFTPDAMVFARYSTGFRPGGPNIIAPGLVSHFDPDRTTNYEGGFKGRFWGGRGTLDVTGYYEEWNNIIVAVAVGGLAGYTNGGDARVYGVESALSLRPVPELTLQATFAYSKGNITHASASAAPTLGAGDTLPYDPVTSGSLSAEYRAPIASDWFGYGSVVARYTGAQWSNFESGKAQPAYLLPAYGMADVHAGVENDRYRIDLFVRNLTDERAQLAANTFFNLGEVTVARPRTFGLSLTVKY